MDVGGWPRRVRMKSELGPDTLTVDLDHPLRKTFRLAVKHLADRWVGPRGWVRLWKDEAVQHRGHQHEHHSHNDDNNRQPSFDQHGSAIRGRHTSPIPPTPIWAVMS